MRKHEFTSGAYKMRERMDNFGRPCGFEVYVVIPETSAFPEHEEIICTLPDGMDERHRATAALIAAEPEMFEALAEAVEKYGKSGGPWNVPSEPGSWIAKAKEALKKARGEK